LVAIAIHDGVYMVDFCVQSVDLADKQIGQDAIADLVIMKLESFEKEVVSKLIEAGIPYELMKKSPQLCSRLWLELDIVPIAMMPHS
jgi:alpha,alpha-trehalose phosphorylase (configuration-retaining)